MVASAYLTIGAMDLVQNLPLTIYHFGLDGRSTPSVTNVFGAGEPIWVTIPSGSIGPSVLVASDSLGRATLSQESTDYTRVSSRFSLSPTLFPPNRNFQLVLQTIREVLPGISIIVRYVAEFGVVPSSARLTSESFSPPTGSLGAQVRLSDSDGNPTTGVRLGLFLAQGNTSTYLAGEKTDLQGRAIFQVGQSLSAGQYGLDVRVLDSNAVLALPLHVSDFTAQVKPTILRAQPINGGITATLVQADDNAAIQGRLVILQNQLRDGNWTISETAYTDDQGRASFRTIPAGPWRASFGGDQFYGSASSSTSGPTGPISAPNPSVSPANSPNLVYGSLASRSYVVPIPETGGCNVPCCVMPIGSLPIISGDSVTSNQITPQCGGGGGGTPISTTTTLFLPSSAYSTIPTVLTGLVKDANGNPVTGQGLEFYNSTSEVHLIGIGNTNSTGYASVVWTPNTVGTKTIMALYIGDSGHYGSSATGTVPVSATPTFVEILSPSPIAYSWDLYNYYNRTGRPIVAPVVTLQLAASGNAGPANIYMPPTSGSSASPPNIPGYSWTGLNQTTVTITFNGTYVQTQAMNWTRNFYLPPCPTPSSCSTNSRFGHMNLTAALSPPSTLYAAASTKLNLPNQNLNSVSSPLAIDNSQIASCPHYTPGCSTLFSTSHGNDIIIVYTHEALDLYTYSCTFHVSDSAGLTWMQRGQTVLNDYDSQNGWWRSQFAEFWARSTNPLSSDNITETCTSGDGYNGFQVFGISGANFISPFDPNVSLPSSLAGVGYGTSVTLSTTNPFDMIISGVQHAGAPVPTPGPGFTTITVTGGLSTEYEIASSPVTNLSVAFGANINNSWEQIVDAIQPLPQVNQTATPPSHIYVGVNATYPYISIKVQNLSVALEAYVAYLAHTLGPPLSSSVQCPATCFNYYGLPVPSLTQGSDFAYVCSSSACTAPAVNTVLNLYNSKGTLCISTTTDYHGIAHLNLAGPSKCTYPYYYLSTPNTQIVLSELFGIEAVSNPYPFYTNFQGYNYAIYAPAQTGRYLLHMHTYYQSSTFTIINPTASYSDVQPAFLSCCDVFVMVEKHLTQVTVGVTPGKATIFDNINATIALKDQAEQKGMPSATVGYSLQRTDPNPTAISSGTLMTDSRGNVTLALGKLSYGNYTLIVSWTGNSTSAASSYQASFTVWRANTIIIIRPGWIQQATAGNTYLFTTSLIDNATKTLMAVPGLTERVYVNGVLYSNTQFCTTSGCSTTNYYLTNPGGNATFPWIPPSAGQYILNATVPQQNYYPKASFSIEVSATLRPVMLIAVNSPAQPNTGDQVTWTIQAYDMMNNASVTGLSITPYINGMSYPAVTTDSNGYATFTNTFTTNGVYNVQFQSGATTLYNSATTHNSVKVFTQTSLTLTGGTVYLGQQNSFSVNLKDANNNPLGGRTISIVINNKSYQNLTADSNGNSQFTWAPTALGSYTITAKFTASSSQDTNYRSSTATSAGNIVVQKLTSIDTAGGSTQSLTLSSASASQSSTLPSVSLSFPSLTSMSITVSFLGASATATASARFSFQWVCAAKINTFFGTICVLYVPVLKTYVDLGIAGVVDLHTISQLLGPANVVYSIQGLVPLALDPFLLGVVTSTAEAGIGLVTLGLTEEPIFAGLIALLAQSVAVLAGFAYGSKSPEFINYLYGLMIPPILGLPCAIYAQCAVFQLPAWLEVPGQVIPELVAATYTWTLYEQASVLGDLYLFSDPIPALELGILILWPAVLIHLEGGF